MGLLIAAMFLAACGGALTVWMFELDVPEFIVPLIAAVLFVFLLSYLGILDERREAWREGACEALGGVYVEEGVCVSFADSGYIQLPQRRDHGSN